MKKIVVSIISLLVFSFTLIGCVDDATIASQNLSKDADMFRINRRVVFYNGITNEYILSVEGKCSINVDGMDKQLELTCKTGENQYKKHFLGLSDNVTYFAEQLESASTDVYHYKVIFKPASIIPNVEFRN
jgi:uncharacterized lipoprotein NlpE involved in copper resistance